MSINADLYVAGVDDRPAYWEDIKSEIARKTTEAFADATYKASAGEITERELRLIVDALYDATVGLAPRDVSDMLYAARAELPL